MRLDSWVLQAGLLALLILLVGLVAIIVTETETDSKRPPTLNGVVVEAVEDGSALAKAGLQAGDVVLAWERLPAPPANPEAARGEIASYFDWWWLETEQAPRGTVRLIVERGGKRRRFAVTPGLWEATVRASMAEDLLAAYMRGKERLEDGEIAAGLDRWREVAARASDWRLRCWLLMHIGDAWGEALAWEQAQEAYGLALDAAEDDRSRGMVWRARGHAYQKASEYEAAHRAFSAAHEIWQQTEGENLARAQDLRSLGIVAFYRGDLTRAASYLQDSLAIREKLAPQSLGVAATLNSLGIVAHNRGDLDRARAYYQRALAIRQKLAPDSLDEAATLNNLGIAARDRGDLDDAAAHYQRALAIRERLAPHSLDVAATLNNLGIVARERGDLDGAGAYYQRALEIRQELAPNSLDVAASWNNLGIVAHARGDLDGAGAYYQRALAIKEQLAPNSLSVAASLANLGIVAMSRGDLDGAATHYRRSLAIRQQLAPNSLHVAGSLDNLGLVAMSRGDLDGAASHYQRSLEIGQKLAPNSLRVAGSLNNLGRVAHERGDLALAGQYHQHSLEIQEQLAPNSLSVASSLNNLGIVAHARGDLALAGAHYQRALKIQEQLAPNSPEVASSFNNLGNVALNRGDLALAGAYYQSAFKIQEQLSPNSLNVATSLNNLGIVARARRKLTLASAYYQRSLAIKEQLAPNSLSVARSLANLGIVARERGDPALAGAYHQRSLEIQQQLAPHSLDVAWSLTSLGKVAQARGDLVEAGRHYEQALEIHRLLAPGTAGEARCLHDLATVRRQQRQPRQALGLLHQALQALETQIDRLGSSHHRQASFRAHRASYYRDTLEVSLQLEQPRQAFHILERSRARTFLAQLAERDLVFSAADLPPPLERQQRILALRRDRIQGQLAGLNPRDHGAEIETIQKQLSRLRREAEELEEDIRNAYPHLAALHYPQPLDFAAARAALDPGTLLLAFSLGEEDTTLFAASLGAPLHVETLAVGEEVLRRRVGDFRRGVEKTLASSRRMAGLQSRARELHDILLAPVSERIAAAERLLILPDGPLYYLPWAALRRSTPDGVEQYLIEHKPVHVAVSATVYAELKHDRRPPQRKGVQVAAFGDPLYPGSGVVAQRNGDTVVRSVAERGIFDWQRLPHSRREVEALVALYQQSARAYLGAAATEERVKTLRRETRILHFATHGHVDERFPMHSFLALSIPQQLEKGRDNGLLQVWEIYEHLRLDADLVVLSACQTGMGEELQGEGIMGLTRAFHYAGARSILATLWSVHDASTAELMVRFHQNLRAGLPKDEALRAAQLTLLDDPIPVGDGEKLDASAPSSWAAFQLYGDWQ